MSRDYQHGPTEPQRLFPPSTSERPSGTEIPGLGHSLRTRSDAKSTLDPAVLSPRICTKTAQEAYQRPS